VKCWWNKESVILKKYLKYFSMEKYIGVCRKEDILKHATSLTSQEKIKVELIRIKFYKVKVRDKKVN
jgi:hypothetical protein